EAYALLGSSQQDFGQEAIHTLVEEMTRHAENLVVVLAGYPQEMSGLLLSNPGLVSRFKKYIHFADYSVAELVCILQQAAQQAGYAIEASAVAAIAQSLETAEQKQMLQGNGRLSYNLLQEAIQNQAMRLTSIPREAWDEKLLATLSWSDFEPLLTLQLEETGTKD
ncbi:AAA family ATPase, partial [Mesorhizobium sp. M00.F.Ca.ET.186.01.1.1]